MSATAPSSNPRLPWATRGSARASGKPRHETLFPAATDYAGTWNETDLTLSKPVAGAFQCRDRLYLLCPGLANKDLTPDPDDAQEIFATISLTTLLAPTSPSTRRSPTTNNWYALLGISHTFELGKQASLKLAAGRQPHQHRCG
jgi:hypothetical protein